jgi:hypothetical protein
MDWEPCFWIRDVAKSENSESVEGNMRSQPLLNMFR